MNDLAALHDMTLFVEVAHARSFSEASRRLGVPVATVSRRIAAMERRFGVRLFDRTTRRVELTDVGARHLERCAPLAHEAQLAQEALRSASQVPTGHVRVAMPIDLGVYVIGPLLPDFARQYPGITLEIELSTRTVHLVEDRFDIAVRLGPIRDEQLVARNLGEVGRALYASASYLARAGRPVAPGDLEQHETVILNPRPNPASPLSFVWTLSRGEERVAVPVHGRFLVNSIGLVQTLAARGMGIAMLTPELVLSGEGDSRLERVLPEWAVPPLRVHAVVTSRLQPANVKAFIDFLRERWS